jgi:hypothetical protein
MKALAIGSMYWRITRSISVPGSLMPRNSGERQHALRVFGLALAANGVMEAELKRKPLTVRAEALPAFVAAPHGDSTYRKATWCLPCRRDSALSEDTAYYAIDSNIVIFNER